MSRGDVARALRTVNVLGSGMAAGGQVTLLLAVVPVVKMWPPERSVDLHRETLTSRPDRFLRPVSIASVVCGVLSQVAEERRSRSSIAWTAGGIASMLGVNFLSEKFEFPVNRMLNELPGPSEVPENYDEIRKKWDQIHTLRAACGTAAAACFALSALTRAV
jgi:uncharacterized membrane protein